MKSTKYAVLVTRDNMDALGEWRTSGSLYCEGGYCISEEHGHKGYWTDFPRSCKIISWEQFQQDVMGIVPKEPTYEIY